MSFGSGTIDLLAHFFISLSVGFLLWYLFGHQEKRTLIFCLLIGLLTGFFIDIDHFFDYYIAYGFTWNFSHLIHEDYFETSGKNYVLFHGYEYVLILGIIAFLQKNKNQKLYFSVASVAMFAHLVTDIVLFSIPLQTYFLIHRFLTGFKV